MNYIVLDRMNRFVICLVGHTPVDPVDPVRKLYSQNTLFDAYSPPLEDSMLDVRCLQPASGGFDVH